SGISRFESDGGTFAAKALQGCLLVIDQCHYDFTGVGGISAFDNHCIPVDNSGIDHRISFHLKRVMLSRADHFRRKAEGMGLILDGGDWYTRSYSPHDLYGDSGG